MMIMMSKRGLSRLAVGALGLTLTFAVRSPVVTAGPALQTAPPKDSPTMKHAAGTFDVKLVPQSPDPAAGEPVLGRMTINKVFKGDLEGISKGEMLAMGTSVKDSAGYVAMERVTGSLSGKSGSFALQHSGTMNQGVPTLSVTVVPDSGTGDLVGIEGRMTIDISGGQHKYTFDYALPGGR